VSKFNWKFSEYNRNAHRFDIDLPRVGNEFFALLVSDAHWDNPHCDRKLMKKLFDKAKSRGAPILDIGDFHCAMQGKWDKRGSKTDIRHEHQTGDYLDSLVRTADEWLSPYSDNLTLRGYGNHETSIKKHHETDLVERLTERLRARGSPAKTGGFSGFVRFQVNLTKTKRGTVVYWYHHGHGGGGPVTRGVIQSNRHAVFLPDADIVHTGHTHDYWMVPIARVKLSQNGTVEHCRQVHVSTAGFKEEYGDGHGGWHIERGAPPKPVGAAWLRIFRADTDTIDFEITEAR
jgi:diadenosine tetraphosphatase ApaH/serine/threonine PP2A family protein phosphatase